jgi:ribonuclease P protein component
LKQFGLSKKERIKSKQEFELLYTSGTTINARSQKLKAIFFVEETNESGVKAAFVVYKKAGKAVWRNRIKRLLRVSYRLNKSILLDICNEKNISLLVAFAVKSLNEKNNNTIKLSEILPDVVSLMEQIKARL